MNHSTTSLPSLLASLPPALYAGSCRTSTAPSCCTCSTSVSTSFTAMLCCTDAASVAKVAGAAQRLVLVSSGFDLGPFGASKNGKTKFTFVRRANVASLRCFSSIVKMSPKCQQEPRN